MTELTDQITFPFTKCEPPKKGGWLELDPSRSASIMISCMEDSANLDRCNFDKRLPNGRASLNKTPHLGRKAAKIMGKWTYGQLVTTKMSHTVTNVTRRHSLVSLKAGEVMLERMRDMLP